MRLSGSKRQKNSAWFNKRNIFNFQPARRFRAGIYERAIVRGKAAFPGGDMRKLSIFMIAICLILAAGSDRAQASAFLEGLKGFVSLEECLFNETGQTLTLLNCRVRAEGLGEGTVGKIVIEDETPNKIGRLSIQNLQAESLRIREMVYEGISGDFSALPVITAALAKALKPGGEEAETLAALRYALSGLADFHADKCGITEIGFSWNGANGIVERVKAFDISAFSCGPYLAEGISGGLNGAPVFSIASAGWQGISMDGMQNLINMDLTQITRQNALTSGQIAELSKCSIRDMFVKGLSLPQYLGGADKITLNLEGADSKLKGNLQIAGASIPGAALEQFEIRNYPPVLEADLEDDFTFDLSPDGVGAAQNARLDCKDLLDARASFTAFFNDSAAKLERLDMRLTDLGLQKYISNEQKTQLVILAAMLSPKIAQDTRKFLTIPGSVINVRAANIPDDPEIQINLEQAP